jgi:chemotaxis protein CheX
MLGVELDPGEVSAQPELPDANGSVMSFIGLAGTWAGTGCVSCSPALACRICSLMLMTETVSVDEDVLDAVAELTNMIVGNVKTDLESQLGPLGLSIPTVVFGRNFKTKTAASTEWIVVRFSWEGEAMIVKICLAPSDRTPHAMHHGPGHACLLDV